MVVDVCTCTYQEHGVRRGVILATVLLLNVLRKANSFSFH